MATISLSLPGPATRRAIQRVCTGRHGRKDILPEDVPLIREEWARGEGVPLSRTMLLTGLFLKGTQPHEKPLWESAPASALTKAEDFLAWLMPGQESWVSRTVPLLRGQTLSLAEARQWGDVLFDPNNPDHDNVRILVAEILRYRHETIEEYIGLLKALESRCPRWGMNPDKRQTAYLARRPRRFIQISEPFDGMARHDLITPVVAETLRREGYSVLWMTGPGSGPKDGFTLREAAEALALPRIDSPEKARTFGQAESAMMAYLDQSDLSSVFSHWSALRRAMVKRPFMATLERVFNPCGMDILIASVFHPPYAEKMLKIAQAAGFKAAVIVMNGLEGSLAFPWHKTARVSAAVLSQPGDIEEERMTFPLENTEASCLSLDERGEVSPRENLEKIKTSLATGRSGDALFDSLVRHTGHGLLKALEWIHGRLRADSKKGDSS